MRDSKIETLGVGGGRSIDIADKAIDLSDSDLTDILLFITAPGKKG